MSKVVPDVALGVNTQPVAVPAFAKSDALRPEIASDMLSVKCRGLVAVFVPCPLAGVIVAEGTVWSTARAVEAPVTVLPAASSSSTVTFPPAAMAAWIAAELPKVIDTEVSPAPIEASVPIKMPLSQNFAEPPVA
jgi:hypothetical protein